MSSNQTIQNILDNCKAELISRIRVNIHNNIHEFAPIKFQLNEISQQDVNSIHELIFIDNNASKPVRIDFEYKGHKFLGGFITELSNTNGWVLGIGFNYTDVDTLYLVGGVKSRDIIQRQVGSMYIAEPGLFWNGYLEYVIEEPRLAHLQV